MGSVNPFSLTEKITGTEKVTQKQLDETGAPMAVRRKWSDSYDDRDPSHDACLKLASSYPPTPFTSSVYIKSK